MSLPITKKTTKNDCTCGICGREATSQSSGGMRCINCDEVEVRLPLYLCSKEGMTRAIKAIATGNERNKAEMRELENMVIENCKDFTIPQMMEHIRMRKDLVTEAARTYSIEEVAALMGRELAKE